MKKPFALEATPQGYKVFVTNAGIKDQSPDLGVVFSEKVATAAALFTKNKVKGNPVLLGKKNIQKGRLKALVVNSKNSNVATGKEGYKTAVKICETVGAELSVPYDMVFPSSTGVIGHLLPKEKIISALEGFPSKAQNTFVDFAESIMTTDTFPKFISRKVGDAVIVGVAKGSGMIEPNMATMLAYFFTDAKISSGDLYRLLKKTTSKTFNSLSVDTDTSTSDTVMAMANGIAGNVNKKEFAIAFLEIATELTRLLARDGEGATKLFTVTVRGAHSEKEAKKIGKSIINSPLVKTAIYKGDPNWGRLFMAIGKTPRVRVKPHKIKLLWGGREYDNNELAALSEYLKGNEELELTVDLGVGSHKWTVYGCDYTEEYVKINAYYTT